MTPPDCNPDPQIAILDPRTSIRDPPRIAIIEVRIEKVDCPIEVSIDID